MARSDGYCPRMVQCPWDATRTIAEDGSGPCHRLAWELDAHPAVDPNTSQEFVHPILGPRSSAVDSKTRRAAPPVTSVQLMHPMQDEIAGEFATDAFAWSLSEPLGCHREDSSTSYDERVGTCDHPRMNALLDIGRAVF